MESELNRPLNRNDLFNYDRLKIKWKALSVEDIILDGLYLNCIRLVKEHFDKVFKIELNPNRIRDIGLKSVLQLLADRDLRGAETLLNHMSFDFNQKIYQICFYTPYKQLRDYLINVLIDKKKLNEYEIEIINYLKNLETYYPCRSLNEATKLVPLHRNYGSTSVEKNSENSKKNENFISREMVQFLDKIESIQISDRYSHMILEWIRELNTKSKKEILIDSIILKQDLTDSDLELVDSNTLWSLLCEQNNLDLILEWIEFSYSEMSNNELKHSQLFKTKLNQEMIEDILSTRFLSKESKEICLNRLARYDAYSSVEKNDLEKFIKRLSASRLFFDEKSFKLRDDNFHLQLIANFLNKKYVPVNFLWYYLNYYKNVNENRSSQALLAEANQDEISSSKCLRIMLAFRQNLDLKQQQQRFSIEPANYFSNICIKNFEYCLNSKQNENLHISNLFTPKYKEHHLLALAMSLYCDIPLSANESATLDHLIDQYPSLRLLVDSKFSPQPISLYALLQNATRFDVTKCFTWQKANTISFKLDNNDNRTAPKNDSAASLESFDMLKQRLAFKDSLDYSFFIKKGRPSFAYYYFVQSQLRKYGKINRTLTDEARLRTNLILIENYTDSKIKSSCIAFSELINADTFKLKLNICLMNVLTEHYKKKGMDQQLAEDKCKNVFVDFFKGDIEPKRIISLFENVLTTNMIENFDLKNMFSMESCSLWLPLMCFSKVHNLPYSCKYLHLCAEANQWLMYLIFAQLYQIPLYQKERNRSKVISGLEYFSDTGLKQHLDYALHNVIGLNSNEQASSASINVASKLKNAINKTGDRLTSMLGTSWLTKSKKKQRKTASKDARKNADRKSNDSSENEDNFDFDESIKSNELIKDTLESIDFYELLINCQNSSDPVLRLQLEALKWQTPVLAVFATFYPHDRISCLCTFLYASMRINQKQIASLEQKLAMTNSNQKLDSKSSVSLFGLNELKEAIQIAASKSYLRTLLNSLRIFIPKTILNIYVEFLYNVFVNKDANRAQALFSNYKYELIKVTLSKHQSFMPLEWYEEVISKLARITILKCNAIEDLQILTNILGPANEYRRLIKLVYTLKSNKIGVNLEEWLDLNDQSEQFTEICFKVLEELLKMQKFAEAEQLADYCELSKDRIHLARIGQKIEILRLNNDFDEILTFWKNAHVQLQKIGIKDTDFIDFLKFQNSRSNLMLERIVLLNLICQLCPNDQETSKSLFVLLFHFVVEQKKKNEVTSLREIFKKMLLFGRLKDDPVKELIDYVMKEGRVNDFSESSNNMSEQDKDALNLLLYNLVEIGKLTQAYVIAKHFRYFNQDFRILLNMIYICLDMIKPEELDYHNQTLDTASFKAIRLTNVLRSLSRPSDSNQSIEDRTNYLEKLVGLCNFGNKFSKRIKLDFQIANEILNISYTKLLSENEWHLLKLILYTNYSNKYEIAREFVKTYDLNAGKLSDFVLEEILSTLNYYAALNKNNYASEKVQTMFDPTNNAHFSSLIRIFDNKDINLFGVKLLNKSRAILNDPKCVTDDYSIPTELLIRSHDCFIQSCSMEGISNVLQACKLCATRLEKAGEFNLMIRLLTGIGHFSEMTYIMDFLWNNHQFEMLFGKGMIKGTGKEDTLKLALLDYLKRYHPNDHETYTMVTLNFTMHREIAQMLEEAAYEQLKIFENKRLENTSECLLELQSILQYFTDAAQSFNKEGCVKQTESCIKKARLIALQIHFLSQNIVVINLTNSAASMFVLNHPKFWEANIVCEAYNRKSDWPQALFNQFVLKNNEKYFQDFKTHLQLNSQMIEEVCNRYKIWLNESSNEQKLAPQSLENMKKLLRHSKDILKAYRLATSLADLNGLVDEMQTKKCASILNDFLMNKKK